MIAPNTRIVSWKQALIADDHSPHTIRAYERTIEDCAIWFVDTLYIPFQPEHISECASLRVGDMSLVVSSQMRLFHDGSTHGEAVQFSFF